jgi:hypothetical protein
MRLLSKVSAVVASVAFLASSAGLAAIPDEAAAVHSSAAFKGYAGFSSDGLLFVFSEFVPEGIRLQWLSATTNTVEKTSLLDTPEQRQAALSDLKEEGFPPPGMPSKIPPPLSVAVQQGSIVVLFGKIPASRPFKPFLNHPAATPEGARILAVSSDGKEVGIMVYGRIGKAGKAPPEFRVITLFE